MFTGDKNISEKYDTADKVLYAALDSAL